MDDFLLGDIGPWLQMSAMSAVEAARHWPLTIVGPCDLALGERIRAEARSQNDLGSAVPADIFALAAGEPSRRDVTKIGGLPYRPRSRPWPKTDRGENLRFVVQFRFTESRDILSRELPGDLLLVFAMDDPAWFGEGGYHYEWYPLGLTDLIEEPEVPPSRWRFSECYGVRWRSCDYTDERAIMSLGKTFLIDSPNSRRYIIQPYARWNGLKIGGAPYWENHERIGNRATGDHGFLCALAAVYADPYGPYPWVNHPSPFTDEERKRFVPFDFSDGFILNFFLNERGEVHHAIQTGG